MLRNALSSLSSVNLWSRRGMETRLKHVSASYSPLSGGAVSEAKVGHASADQDVRKRGEEERSRCVLVLSTFLKKRTRVYRMLGVYAWVSSLLRPCWEKRRSAQLRKLHQYFLLSSLKSCKLCLYLYYAAVKWLTVTFEDHVLSNLRSALCIYQHLFYEVVSFARRETSESLYFVRNSISSLYLRDDKSQSSEYATSEDETETETEDEDLESDVESSQYISEEEELDEQTLQLYCHIATNALRRLPSYQIKGDSTSSCCSICLEQYYDGQYVRVLRCGHPFHVDCVFRWCSLGHFTCPNCRAKLLN